MTSGCVVLVSPRNPLNIGAAARAMSNFGFFDLRLVDAYDVAFREAKSAVNAEDVLLKAREFPSVGEATADCTLVLGTTGSDFLEPKQPVRRLDLVAPDIHGHDGPVAILFGSEKSGLSHDDLSHCHWLIHIPSRPGHRSINLGQAVAVVLYELIRARQPAKAAPSKSRASVEQGEVVLDRLREILQISGYYDHTATAGAERRLRTLIRRLPLTKADATVWLGILRQVLWKLKQK